MSRYRRSRYFYIFYSDEQLLDFQAFLSGSVRFTLRPEPQVFSVLTSVSRSLGAEEIDLLGRLPESRWLTPEEVGVEGASELLENLALSGLVLSDADDGELALLREREKQLVEMLWDARAAHYHFAAKQPREMGFEDEDEIVDLELVAAQSSENFERFVAAFGKPPPTFHQRSATTEGLVEIELPRERRQGGLYDALAARRTVRAFDLSEPLRIDELDTLLYYVFGCHGQISLTKDVTLVKRTSPSGGSLHPIEAYPLLIDVAGAATGIYHYNMERHSLVPLRTLEKEHASELATKMAGGQAYAGGSSVLILLTARFERNFWKYRNNLKTYSVVLIDLGHLGQTFYLVAGELGLGAYFSAAVNAPLIEDVLEIDGISEGAVAVCGCGRPAENELGLDFEEYPPLDRG